MKFVEIMEWFRFRALELLAFDMESQDIYIFYTVVRGDYNFFVIVVLLSSNGRVFTIFNCLLISELM